LGSQKIEVSAAFRRAQKRVWSREQNPDIFAMARSKAPKPSLTMAYLSLLLAAVGVVLSLVALVGIWWFGEINPAIFGGAFKGRGWWPRDRDNMVPASHVQLIWLVVSNISSFTRSLG